MKKIVNEYKEQIRYFISNKKYCIPVIIVMILSYGFTITHYSIGLDDLCFNRYVKGTYILSAKRWGTWGLYNILGIEEFTPFWLDAVVAILMVVIVIVISAFIRKQYKDKIKIWGYTLFSCLIISNPLINQFFIYQSTNLAVALSNLIVIICAIVIFENYFNENKKWINIVCGIILMIPISMYESCAQTYIVMLFATMFIKFTTDTNITNKKILKYFSTSISMLVLGMILYFITGKITLLILEKLNYLQTNHAYSRVIWVEDEFLSLTLKNKILVINRMLLEPFSIKNGYLPIVTFVSFSFMAIVIECVKLIKTSKVFKFMCVLGLILSNFILAFILLKVLFRMQFSIIISSAFLGLYIYQTLCNGKYMKYVCTALFALLLIYQTRALNQYFYNDYKRYEKEKNIANDIAINVMKTCDYKNKPILCFMSKQEARGERYKINKDNGQSVIAWGTLAFDEYQTEVTNFINEQGYDFIYITEEQAKKAYDEINKMYLEKDNRVKDYIIELEDVIMINLEYYEF